MKKPRILVICAQSAATRHLSYHHGWPYHLSRHPRIRATVVDLLARRFRQTFDLVWLVKRRTYDAVLVMHSAFSNVCNLTPAYADAIAGLRCPKAYFIGNEYKHMPEKIAMARRLGTTLFVTMNFNPRIVGLYRDAVGCAVTSLPSGALDEARFFPGPPMHDRSIDIGFRGFDEPLYFGHQERRAISTAAAKLCHQLGLNGDISMDPHDRIAEDDWADFLRRCRAQLGTYSGHDYFEIDDRTRLATNAYIERHPDATFQDIWNLFFKDYSSPIRARMITGRHIEAAGTRTVQVLPEGDYSGYFKANEHYIAVKPDLSDLADSLRRLSDHADCERIARNAEDVVRGELTYAKSIDRIVGRLVGQM
jgi:hypothetical protein